MTSQIKLTALLLVISCIGSGQEFPKQKSDKHVLIKGTNIFMIPPELFQASTNFKGFQNPVDQTSMVITMEIPGPYSEVSKGFTSDMLQTQGMELRVRKEIQVANFNGLLVELDQKANGLTFSKHILIYGDEKSTTLINGVYLMDSVLLGKQIKESILTTFVDTELKSNARETLDYNINESVGSLKFHSVIGNGMLFNRDLRTPTQSIDKATLFTDKSFANIEIEDKKIFCISRVKKYPDDYSIIPGKGINEIEIDSLKGFELFAKNNKDDTEEMYQVILFDIKGGYYLFVGTYLKGSATAVNDIKNIIKTFNRKK